MFYIVYKITNLINNKYYIGKHQTKILDDGYMGSGKLLKLAISKYGLENFKKEILHIFDNEQDMNSKEKELVTINEQSYNLQDGGMGGFSYINRSGIPKFKGKKHSEETKKKIGQKSKGNQRSLGRILSDETKIKIGENTKKKLTGQSKSKEHRQRLSESLKTKLLDLDCLKNKQDCMLRARSQKSEIITDQTKEKLSIAAKKAWENRPRPKRDWNAIQHDFNLGMSKLELFEKYNLTRNIIRDAKQKGLFTGSYKNLTTKS